MQITQAFDINLHNLNGIILELASLGIEVPTAKYKKVISLSKLKKYDFFKEFEDITIKNYISTEELTSENIEVITTYKGSCTLVFAKGKTSTSILGLSNSLEELDNILNKLKEQLGKHKRTLLDGDNKVLFDIRYLCGYGPGTSERHLKCPSVASIEANYSIDTISSIKSLVEALKAPQVPGKVIFWYGPPGTGKTYLVRALCRELAETKIQFNYIADPESLMGNNEYLMEVCLNDSEERNLVIMEDVPSMVLTSARDEKSNLMAKLLNITDGILGQGSDDIFLITTNEPAIKIDPAFLRPGRVLQVLEVPKLEIDFCNKWLGESKVESPHTLAELYKIKNKVNTKVEPQEQKKVGFHA